jgi:hypothetical protein
MKTQKLFCAVSLALARLLPLTALPLLTGARQIQSWNRPQSAPFSDFNNNVVFKPTENYTSWKTLYARTVQLSDDSLLITWEDYPPEPPPDYFPIYRSTDGGASWSEYSRVNDTVNGWGLRYQPFLYLLPYDFGGYPAGTVLVAGVSTPDDLSASKIDMYASMDNGLTWEFVSHIAMGGTEIASNGNPAIWEPFFLMYGNEQLICYYSDQRDPAYGQKLVHVTTSDLRTWGEVVDDVTYPEYTAVLAWRSSRTFSRRTNI